MIGKLSADDDTNVPYLAVIDLATIYFLFHLQNDIKKSTCKYAYLAHSHT
jgi:hypothetical protein